MLSLRLADAHGAPDPSLEFTADPSMAPEMPPKGKTEKKTERAAKKLEGPVPQFETLVAGKKPNPRHLEAYARYLYLTSGDDPVQHQAQDLARRAANAEPSLARHLLAADLSDDRNEKREWLNRAQDLVGADAHPIELLLAQAELARTGTNWREATPFYDQVLAEDPYNIRGVLGRVELYREARLKRTALVTLQSGLQRKPTSVALLRIHP